MNEQKRDVWREIAITGTLIRNFPYPFPDSLLLDTPLDVLDRELGHPADDDEYEERHMIVEQWAKRRNITIRV